MKEYYESLKGLINQEMISKASTMLNENETNVSTAVSSTISSLLGLMLKKGDTQQMKNILEEAGTANITTVSKVENLWNENPSQDQRKLGDDFLQQLLGDKAAAFTSAIYKSAGTSKVATNRLVAMVAPIVTGFLGEQLVKGKWGMNDLLTEINKQKSSFAGFIPPEMINTFGLSNELSKDYKVHSPKKNRSWITWVVLLILLLLLFFWWRSCRNTDTEVYRETVTETVTPVKPQTPTTNSDREMTELTLSNGTKINVYKNGTEEKMIEYLQSNDYKNATENDLKNKWFLFDNITFEYGSSTQLTSGSKAQVDNIIAILTANKNAKVKIAGFADKKGTENANMEVSKERAKTIESMLEKGGVGSQVVKIEGFGDEYAKHSAAESNTERESDRDIAIRFVK